MDTQEILLELKGTCERMEGKYDSLYTRLYNGGSGSIPTLQKAVDDLTRSNAATLARINADQISSLVLSKSSGIKAAYKEGRFAGVLIGGYFIIKLLLAIVWGVKI